LLLLVVVMVFLSIAKSDLVFLPHPISLLSGLPNHFQFFLIPNYSSSNKIVIFFSIYAGFTSFKLRLITHTTTSHSADVFHQSNLFVHTHRINLHGKIFVFCTTLCNSSILWTVYRAYLKFVISHSLIYLTVPIIRFVYRSFHALGCFVASHLLFCLPLYIITSCIPFLFWQ
jgi:hypothetical protein